jgi:hypothetical protein
MTVEVREVPGDTDIARIANHMEAPELVERKALF